jgi:hypothetical protein
MVDNRIFGLVFSAVLLQACQGIESEASAELKRAPQLTQLVAVYANDVDEQAVTRGDFGAAPIAMVKLEDYAKLKAELRRNTASSAKIGEGKLGGLSR